MQFNVEYKNILLNSLNLENTTIPIHHQNLLSGFHSVPHNKLCTYVSIEFSDTISDGNIHMSSCRQMVGVVDALHCVCEHRIVNIEPCFGIQLTFDNTMAAKMKLQLGYQITLSGVTNKAGIFRSQVDSSCSMYLLLFLRKYVTKFLECYRIVFPILLNTENLLLSTV